MAGDKEATIKINLRAVGNLDQSLDRLRDQVKAAQSGLSSGALPQQMMETAKLNQQLSQLKAQAAREAGLSAPTPSRGLLPGRLLHHTAHAIGHAVDEVGVGGGLGQITAGFVTFGLAGAAAGATMALVNEGVKAMDHMLHAHVETLAEVTASYRAAQGGLGRLGGNAPVSGDDLRRSMSSTMYGRNILQMLEMGRGNPQMQQNFLASEETQLTARLRAQEGRGDPDAQRANIEQALMNTNAQGGPFTNRSGMRADILRRNGVNPDEHFGRSNDLLFRTTYQGLEETHMTRQRARELADMAVRPRIELMEQIGQIRQMRRTGIVPDTRAGATTPVGIMQAGQSGDIGSLHIAIQEAAIRGAQKDWQNLLLDEVRSIRSGGIPVAIRNVHAGPP